MAGTGITQFTWLNATTTRCLWQCDYGGLVNYSIQYWYKLKNEDDWHWLSRDDQVNPNKRYDDFDWSTVVNAESQLDKVSIWWKPLSDGGWGFVGQGGLVDNYTTRELSVGDTRPSIAPEPSITVDRNKLKAVWTGINGTWGHSAYNGTLSGSDLHIDELEITIKKNNVVIDGPNFIPVGYSSTGGVGSVEYELELPYGSSYQLYYRGVNKVERDSDGEVTSFQGPGLDDTYYGTEPINFVTAPATPEHVTWRQTSQVLGTSNQITISWNHDPLASNFKVDFINTDTGNFNIENTISSVQNNFGEDFIQMSLNGGRYTMRLYGQNEAGKGSYKQLTITVGLPPQKPTVWTDQNQYIYGSDTPKIYWQHGSIDSSRMYAAEVEIRYGQRGTHVYSIDYTDRDPNDWNKNGSFTVPDYFTETDENGENITNNIRSSEKVYYRVRTAGANGSFGEWSVEGNYMRYMTPKTETWIFPGTMSVYPDNPDAENTTSTIQLSSFPFTIFTNIYETERPYTSQPTYKFYPLNMDTPYYNNNGLINVYIDNTITKSAYWATAPIENIPEGTNVKTVEALQPYDIRRCTIWILESDYSNMNFRITYNVDTNNASGEFVLDEYPLTKKYYKIVVCIGTGSTSDKETEQGMGGLFKIRQKTTPLSAQKVREITYSIENPLLINDYEEDTGEIKTIAKYSTIWSWTGVPPQDRYWVYHTVNFDDLAIHLNPFTVYTINITATFESGIQVKNWKFFQWRGASNINVPSGPIGVSYKNTPDANGDDSLLHTMSIKFKWPNVPTYSQAKNFECYVYRRNIDATMTLIADHIQLGPENSDTDYRIQHSCEVIDYHPFIGTNTYIIGSRDKRTGETAMVKLQYTVESDFPIIDFKEHWLPYILDTNSGYRERVIVDKIYNIQINETNKVDKEEVQFAGRLRKNSYYGSSQTEEQTWNFVLPRDDKETLYKLRLMSLHKGSVYIREVNGRGYWADVEVTINDTYNTDISTASFKITVTGGVNEA